MASRRGGICCAAVNCSVTSYNSQGLSLFRFPKDEHRCKRWRVNVRRADLDKKNPAELNKYYRLCSKHFEDSQFMNSNRDKLIWNAVPTLFDVPNPVLKLTPSRRVVVRQDVTVRPCRHAPLQMDVQDVTNSSSSRPDTTDTSARQQVQQELASDSMAHLQHAAVTDNTPRKVHLKRKICSLRRQLLRTKQKTSAGSGCSGNKYNISRTVPAKKRAAVNGVLSQLEQLLPSATFALIKTQLLMAVVHKHGRRWSRQDKLFALSIFYQSRKSYKLLCKLLCLPSHRTLQRDLQKWNIYPGFSAAVMETLAVRVKHMAEKEKDCVLVFDEMALRSRFIYNKERDSIDGFEDFGPLGTTQHHADHALVFMLRGIAYKWKQPLGYVLVAGSVKPVILQSLVYYCLDKLDSVGLAPVALVCDQGATNRCCLESLCNVSVEQPFIQHNDRKVFVVYDPPHLLKNVRNNLKKSNFCLDAGNCWHEISWHYVQNFHDFDKTLPVRMAPKLTDRHLELPPFSNMRVNLAAQVMSHSVAAGIQTLCSLGKLHNDAVYTAQFIDQFDKLFNSVNSRTVKSSQPMAHAVTPVSGHEKFWSDMIAYLNKLQVANSHKMLPCITGWKLSITSLLDIWKFLHTDKHYHFLLTSRFNQDCVENLFSIIRGSGGHRDNPDVLQFRASFRTVAVNKLFLPVSGANCEVDCDSVLLEMASLSKVRPTSTARLYTDAVAESTIPCELVCEDDYDDILPMCCEHENVVVYMGGYLLRKVGFSHSCTPCDKCANIFMAGECTDQPDIAFTKQKTFHETAALIFPSPEMAKFVKHLEVIFMQMFPHVQHSVNILGRMFLYAVNHVDIIGCGGQQCVNRVHQMMKLYLRVRIHAKTKVLTAEIALRRTGKRNRKAKCIVNE